MVIRVARVLLFPFPMRRNPSERTDILVYYNVIITIALASTSVTAYNYHFFFVVMCG